MTMHVFSDDEEVVIAADATDAKRVAEEHVNSGFCAGTPPLYVHPTEIEFQQWPDDKVFTVHEYYEDGRDETLICSEWANVHGRGYLCSLEY